MTSGASLSELARFGHSADISKAHDILGGGRFAKICERGNCRPSARSQELLVVTLVFAEKNSLCVAIVPRAKRAIVAQLKLISTPMPDDLGQPKLGKHGGKRIKGQQGNAVTLRSRGNSRDYILARLEREGLTDWIEAILLRKISAFAVAVELGWAKRPQTLSGENCNQARRRAFDIRALADGEPP